MLAASPLVQVVDVGCSAHRGGPAPVEVSRTAHLVLPLRGVFVLHRCHVEVAVDVTTALLLGDGDEYAVSHPCDDGDDCMVIAGDVGLFEDVFGCSQDRTANLTAADQLLLRRLRRVLHAGAETHEAEEATLGLLTQVGCQFGAEAAPRIKRLQQRRVAEARALLAASPSRRWTLVDVAAAVQCSPYHLARQFRAISGETLARHLLKLRLAAALERLSEGEDDLARLAVELGFSHHSHFSARFREVFGISPAAARRLLTPPVARELSKIVTAKPKGPPVPSPDERYGPRKRADTGRPRRTPRRALCRGEARLARDSGTCQGPHRPDLGLARNEAHLSDR